MTKKRKRHYVNNPDFLAALNAHREACEAAPEDEQPVIPDYIGKCIMQIATRLSHKPNFMNYSYKDEMINDGIENAIKYGIKNFDGRKYQNPFAYFTQIIYFAFLRRIEKEKTQTYIKHKVMQRSVIMGVAFDRDAHSTAGSADYIKMDPDYMNTFVENYEARLDKKRKPNTGTPLEKMIEENEDKDGK